MYFIETRPDFGDYVLMAQVKGQELAFVNFLINFRIPYNAGYILAMWATVSF
jgi:hypothetical protein